MVFNLTKETKVKIVGLGIVFLLPFALLIIPKEKPQILTEIFLWLLLILTIFWIKKIENQSLLSIGINLQTFGRSTIINTVLLLISLSIGVFIFQSIYNYSSLSILVQAIVIPKTIIFLRAGIVEEVLFRGYGYTRLNSIIKKPYVSLIISSTIFSLLHISAGIHGLLISLVLGLILGLFFIWKKDLISNIFAHFLIDFLFAS